MNHSDTRPLAAWIIGLSFVSLILPARLARADDKPKPDAPAAAVAVPAAAPEPADPNERAAEKLKKPIKAAFKEIPLQDAIGFVSEVTGVDIIVIWRTIETTGIDRKAPIDLNLKNPLPADAVLRLIFRMVGGGLESNIEDGVMIVSAPEPKPADAPAAPVAQAAEMKTEIYELAEMIQKGDGAAPAEKQAEQLLELVRKLVAPTSWAENGGGPATAALLGTKLIIKNTEEAQTEVAKLLLMLKDKKN